MDTVRRWIREGVLPAMALGPSPKAGYRIKRDDVEAFIARQYRRQGAQEPGQLVAAGAA